MAAITLGPADSVPEGEARVFEADGTRLAVCRVEGKFYAVEDLCTHDDGPLGEGSLEGCQIICPRHGARFDVRSGAAVRMPAVAPVETFVIEVVDGNLVVEL